MCSLVYIQDIFNIFSLELFNVPEQNKKNYAPCLKLSNNACLGMKRTILLIKEMACSMIMISENATPGNLQRINLQCNCEKQEYQAVILQVICSTNTISVNPGVSHKRK